MVGDECIRPLWVRHSDWCGMAGIVQATVETFPNNCTLMFPLAPQDSAPAGSFFTTFRPLSSKEEDDDDPIHPGMHRFESSTPAPSGHGCSSSGHSPAFSSTPLLHRGCFIVSSNWRGTPSSSLGTPPLGGDSSGLRLLDKDLDAGLDADDKGDGEKDLAEGNESLIDAAELEILQGIINLGTQDQVPTLLKSCEKQGPGHLDGSIGSDSSAEDLDAKDTRPKKKGSTPVKVMSNTSQWTEKDLDVVRQICYKTDLECFQKY